MSQNPGLSLACTFKEHFAVAARAAAPGTREPACEKRAHEKAAPLLPSLQSTQGNLSGNYSPEPSIRSIPEEQILNIN